MKRVYRIALLAFAALGLALALVVPGAHAQASAELKAQVDTNQLTTDDTLTLTLTLTSPDNNSQQLGLPALDGFDIVGRSSASQYSMNNGSATSSMVYSYRLHPTQTGVLTIPALTLNENGQTLSTDPITVHVTQGNGSPSRQSAPSNGPFGNNPFGNGGALGGNSFNNMFGNDPFGNAFGNDPFNSVAPNLNIQATTNTPSVYVGQALQYTVRVQSDAMLLGEPQYDAPKFTGFWAHQPPETRQGADGSSITTLLYPTQAGKLTIDPATISADGGVFSNSIERKTDPLTIEVKPLPQGAPAEFTGAVGQFTMTATPDKTSTRVGEPVTVHVEIKGAGNFDTLPDPKWQDDPAWRAFDAKAQTSSQVSNGQLEGARTYDRTLIPTKDGTLTIPGTRYAYFDPTDAKYHTVETQPITVQVAPGDPSTMGNTTTTAGGTTATAPNSAVMPNLKAAPTQLMSAAPALPTQPLFFLLFLIPLGVVATDLTLGWRKHYLAEHSAERRSSRAFQKAARGLKKAAKATNVPVAIAGVVQQYLVDRLGRGLNGLAHSGISYELQRRQVSPDHAARVIALLCAGEASEYGPANGQGGQALADEALNLLSQVEKEIS